MDDVHVDKTIASVRALAGRATSLLSEDYDYYQQQGGRPEYPNTEAVAEAIETAFLQLLTLSESLRLEYLTRIIKATMLAARTEGFARGEFFEDISTWSKWESPINRLSDAIAAVYGTEETTESAKTTDLSTLIKNTLGAITDKLCFDPPKEEADVHDRIEAVLRCVYPDLLRKPPLIKPVANFIPDTGIPSIKTLIEYKFMANENEAGRIANEILADTRGYAKSGWSKIIFVIYETRRFKTYEQWRQLLRSCGVPDSFEVILLHGEPPNAPKVSKKTVPTKIAKKPGKPAGSIDVRKAATG